MNQYWADARDRPDIALTAPQEALLEAVTQANPRTVLVLMNGGPSGIVWAKEKEFL